MDEAVGAVNVFLCVQAGGEWRDFDTNEITRTSSTDSGLITYQLRRDAVGQGLKVWTFDETDAEGNVVPCTMGELR